MIKHLPVIAAMSLLAAGCSTNPAPTTSATETTQVTNKVIAGVRQACQFAPLAGTVTDVVIDLVSKYRSVGAAPGTSALVQQAVQEVCRPILASAAVRGERRYVTSGGIAVHGRFLRSGRRI